MLFRWQKAYESFGIMWCLCSPLYTNIWHYDHGNVILIMFLYLMFNASQQINFYNQWYSPLPAAFEVHRFLYRVLIAFILQLGRKWPMYLMLFWNEKIELCNTRHYIEPSVWLMKFVWNVSTQVSPFSFHWNFMYFIWNLAIVTNC